MARVADPTACILCRAPIQNGNPRDMWSFLCGACEGMMHVADEAVLPWLRAVNQLADQGPGMAEDDDDLLGWG